MRGPTLLAVLAFLVAGCAEDTAPAKGPGAAAGPQPFLVSIPVQADLNMGPEGGCLVQGDQPPVVTTCEASPEIQSVDLLANQTLVEAHLVLSTGGTIPEGSESVLRLACQGVAACGQPLAEVSGEEPLALDWTGNVSGPGLRVEVAPFVRGSTAAATWYPIVASASVTGELVVLQVPGTNLPQELVRVEEILDFEGRSAPCAGDSGTTGVCDYPGGASGRFGPYEQPIEEIHVKVEWTANDPSNQEMTLQVSCMEAETRETCDSFERREMDGSSPLSYDEVLRLPPNAILEVGLVHYTAVPGVVGPVSQTYRVTGILVHLGDPDARHQS